jgi:sigma-E factor negative regulatory protein RseA
MKQASMNQTSVNQGMRENLSAGIDGELSKEQLRFLLRQLDHDASLQQAWAHYHIARDGLRRQLQPMATSGFAARVMLAIEHESLPAVAKRSHWLRWSAGGAIAASVAAAALMIGQPGADSERSAALTAQATARASTAPAKTAAVPAAVPEWLSGGSAGLLSQPASATLGAPFGESRSAYAPHLSAYPPLHRYRTLDNNDGSYLLLLDPEQQTAPPVARQANAAAQ